MKIYETCNYNKIMCIKSNRKISHEILPLYTLNMRHYMKFIQIVDAYKSGIFLP